MELYQGRNIFKFLYLQNWNWSRSDTHTSQTLWSTRTLLLSTSRCSLAPLERSKVLSDLARAFSGAPEGSRSYGDEFKMLQHLTYMIVNGWSCWDNCAGLWGTSRQADTVFIRHCSCRQYSSTIQGRPWRRWVGQLSDAIEGQCGGKIHFSAQLAFSLAGGCQWGAYHDTWILEKDWSTAGGVQR